jgi:hypothetical protein
MPNLRKRQRPTHPPVDMALFLQQHFQKCDRLKVRARWDKRVSRRIFRLGTYTQESLLHVLRTWFARSYSSGLFFACRVFVKEMICPM